MIQPQDLSHADMAHSLRLYRQHSPLTHCMTNDVVQAFTANVLLALGASPAMVIDPQEAAQFSPVADALLVNVGTLTRSRSEAMLAAINAARQVGRPWTLDPVAVGALDFRTAFCQQTLGLKPAAVRGNASEIMALARQSVSGRGVDSRHASTAALQAAVSLAQETGAIVAVTGETDFITDGLRTLSVGGGDPLMTRVVGTGCALSAVVAGFAALPGDRLTHVASACRVVSLAGERAAAAVDGPGSFIPAFLDALYRLNPEVQ
ncbi:hydroxyethylthiazole kinase [Erwinia persicina]|uniref:hydroxyethylthiazole kinase n=1 Tax=Erwinia persicina TaxID=55211 RepID=UPI001C9A6275|nr:hydroxyethylthiazole kinase [Erwinia persicina]MCQ4106199.1 hydroxyethylthiazole kinase [Erwinia persicina]QZQ51575.1 hydroxyethylthiazole kinase [Erwinia persicina]UTX14309.1 hydroxyethylthiazole kinase [Erwinia persicina]